MKHCIVSIMAMAVATAVAPLGCGRRNVPPTERVPVVRRAEILFIGDVMQHLPQVHAAETADGYDFSSQFADLKPIFESADAVVANLETTLADTPPYSGFPRFASPRELARDMAAAGIRYVNLANNHICDRRAAGVRSTLEALEREGIAFTGLDVDSLPSRNPLYLTIDGFRFALLGYTFSTNGLPVPEGVEIGRLDTLQMARDLAAIDHSETDYVVIMTHWGVEYSRTPSRRQREIAEWCFRNGADFVIGSHPHVIQPVEVECDSLGSVRRAVVYSMGNYVSNQNDPYTDYGLLVRLTVEQVDSLPPVVGLRADTLQRIRERTDRRMVYRVERVGDR